MSIEVIELGKDGTYTTMPDPGDVPASPPVVPQAETGATAETAPGSTPGEQGGSAPQTQQDAPPPAAESLAASPAAEEEDADVPDDTATVPFVNRRIKQLNAKRRAMEQQLADERQQNQLRNAQLEAQVQTLTRVLSGSAPDMPETPPPPTGPPSAEQYASHEDFVHAAATYATEQRFQQQRQVEHQAQFQHSLMSREQDFKAQHPDFDTVVRGGLAGKVSPVLQQALMLVPDGPAVAYTLATQPDLVQRLNQMPPPLVLVELGRLSTGASSATSPAVGSTNGTTAQPPAPPLPEPMAPVGGGGSMVAPTYNENLSQKEYEQWRQRTSNLPYLRRS